MVSGARHESDKGELRNLLERWAKSISNKWTSSVESLWSQGEQDVRTLCNQFKIQFSSKPVVNYRYYFDDPTTLPSCYAQAAI